MDDTITLLVATLVTARITRLIVMDQVAHPLRRMLLKRLDSDGWVAYLLTCTWCVSFWIGLGVSAAGAFTGQWGWPWIVPLALAFSYTAGWLASKEGE